MQCGVEEPKSGMADNHSHWVKLKLLDICNTLVIKPGSITSIMSVQSSIESSIQTIILHATSFNILVASLASLQDIKVHSNLLSDKPYV